MATNYTGYIGGKDVKWWDGITRIFSRRTSTGGTIDMSSMGSSVNVLEVYGSGDDASSTSLNNAISAIGTRVCALEMSPGDWAINNDVVVPSNLTLKVVPGVNLTIASGKSITINGVLDAGKHAIFSGSGTVMFGTGATIIIRPEWFGAKGDGTTDDTAAINAAITASASGSILELGNSLVQYLVSAPLVYRSQRYYRGSNTPLRVISGSGKSDIKLADLSNCNVFEDLGYNTNVVADYASHSIFDGVKIDGNRANNTSGHGIVMLGGSYVEVKNCVLKAIAQDGIHITMLTANSTSLPDVWYGSTNVHHNAFYGFGRYGIFNNAPDSSPKNTDSYFVFNLSIDGLGAGSTRGEWAVYLEGSAGWHIGENHSFNTLNGIYLASPANNAAITDNIIEYNGSTTGGPYYGIYSKMTWDAFSLGTTISRNYLWLWGTTAGIEYYGIAIEPNDATGTFFQTKKWNIDTNMFRGFTSAVTRSVGVKFIYVAVTDFDGVEVRIRGSMFPGTLPDARRYEITHHAIFDHLDGFFATTTAESYSITAADIFVQGDATSNNVVAYLPIASRSRGRKIYLQKLDATAFYVAFGKQGSDTIEGSQFIYQKGAMLMAYSDGTKWYVSGHGGPRQRNGTPVGNLTPNYLGEICINTASSTAWIAYGLVNTNWVQISN